MRDSRVARFAALSTISSVRGDREDHATGGLKVALGMWLSAAPVMSVAAGRQDASLRVPVAAYATILCAMFASSRSLDPSLIRSSWRPTRRARA